MPSTGGRLPLGQFISAQRKKVARMSDGRPLSQDDLYKTCKNLEADDQRNPGQGQKGRKGVCFPATHKDQQRLWISQVENGLREPGAQQQRYLERALRLPANLLDELHESPNDYEMSLLARRTALENYEQKPRPRSADMPLEKSGFDFYPIIMRSIIRSCQN
jgi:hypothetical protein